MHSLQKPISTTSSTVNTCKCQNCDLHELSPKLENTAKNTAIAVQVPDSVPERDESIPWLRCQGEGYQAQRCLTGRAGLQEGMTQPRAGTEGVAAHGSDPFQRWEGTIKHSVGQCYSQNDDSEN